MLIVPSLIFCGQLTYFIGCENACRVDTYIKKKCFALGWQKFNSFVPAAPQLSLLRTPSKDLHPPELPSIAPMGLGAWRILSKINSPCRAELFNFSIFFTDFSSVAPRIEPTLYAASLVSDYGACVDCGICLTWVLVTRAQVSSR
jgi:hypothetical protein